MPPPDQSNAVGYEATAKMTNRTVSGTKYSGVSLGSPHPGAQGASPG